MKREILQRLVLAILIVSSWTSIVRGDELRVGVATTDITPGSDYPMSGYYHERLSTGIKDPLQAKAIVFRQGELSAAFVVCDLIAISSDLSSEIRKRVQRQTGIPGDHIIVAATHTHTGPDYGRELFCFTTGRPMPPSAKERKPYVPQMIEAVATVVVRAFEAARPMTLLAGTTLQQTPVAFHRRYLMKNGEVRTWIGLQDPNVLRTAGPIDPEIGILLLRDAAGDQPTAVLSSHALHLDTLGGTLWSADYPFFIERTIQSAVGGRVISLFGNGCCGNINHVDPNAKERASTEAIGTSLGKTIVAAVPQLAPLTSPQLQVRREVVKLPLQRSTPEQLENSKKLLREIEAGKKADFYEHVDAYKRIVLEQLRTNSNVDETMTLIGWGLSATKAGSGELLPVDVQVVTLGRDVAIVALPGEVFVEYGLAIKNASPFKTTLVVELCNNVETIYIPTRNSYVPAQQKFPGGGYEVVNSTTTAGSGELLVEAAVRMLVDCAQTLSTDSPN